ncbi:Mss4-like protein [Aspergillus karnatakaensis]|uniref:GFA family protein n=1 Tax=Aspergillus karnatakaensis TaxID=1810916 RepID=UPI003CCDE7EE
MSTKTLTGACLCGQITVAIDLPASEPNPKIILCHCTSCKKYTGSGFSANIMVPKSAIRWTGTPPKIFTDNSTDSGNALPREICGECGTHFTSGVVGESVTAFKWGTLDQGSRDACGELGGEIYVKRRDGWVKDAGRGGEGVFEREN